MAIQSKTTQAKIALPDTSPSWNRPSLVALGVILLLAAAVRVWAAQDELWLDEIWTLLAIGRNLNSIPDIFTAHHDNNHYLVTLWMYLTTPQHNWVVYRVPSLIAGIGTVALAAQIALRWGRFAALTAAALCATSFVLIFYASEARGYALAGFFSLAALLALDRYLARPTLPIALLFGLLCVLGTLSHLTFVQFYAGALAWSVVALWKDSSYDKNSRWRTLVVPLLQLHLMPLAFLAILYTIDVREMQFGGGDPYDLWHVVWQACALGVGSFGFPTPIVAASIALGIVLAVSGLVLLWREGCDLWIFLAVAFVLAPALLLGLRPPPVLHERYFYLNILFFLILLSYVLSRVARIMPGGLAYAALIAVPFILINGRLTTDFLRVGRGHFLDALLYMAAHSSESDVHISGDAEFSYRLYTEFYGPYVPGDHRFLIHTIVPNMPIEPEWVILNSQDQPYSPKPSILDTQGREAFVLEQVFPYAGLSGAHFAIYHRTTKRAPTQDRSPAAEIETNR